jgi:hypothetical protein
MQVRMGLLNKKSDWSAERFRAYWRDHHARLAENLPGLRSYQQNHVPLRDWKAALTRFTIQFEERIPKT